MVQFYPGIDLHLKRTFMVLMNANGEVVDKQRITNQEITTYLQEKVPQETYAVLETTRNWPFMVDLLNEHVQQVDLVHAKAVRTIANTAVKTDQIDASTLAHLARLNNIPKAYAAPKETRDLRTAMVQAATVACRASPKWYAIHSHLALHCGRRSARVAIARRLLTVIYHMWKRDQIYQEHYGQDQPEAQEA